MKENKNHLELLREYLRNYWKAYGTAFYILEHSIDPKLKDCDCVDKTFKSSNATAYLYLTSTRSFLRYAEKIVKLIEDENLSTFKKNLDIEFPDHKNARDIIEHFEDYALGKGKLQKQGQELKGEPLKAYIDDRNLIFIQVFNLEPIDISKLAWWIDGFNFHLEHELHNIINPNVEWKGFYPDNNYEAPEGL